MSGRYIRNKTFIRMVLRAFPFILLLLFSTGFVAAQDDLSDSIVTERLQTIKQMLGEGQKNANRWWYGWLIGYSAATVAQGTAALISEDKSTRQDLALGAATAFLGAAGQVITSRLPGYAPSRLDLLPERTQKERMNKLQQAEELLEKCAGIEKNGKSWKTHAMYSAINLSSGLITWIGFDRSIWAGLENFALNTVITEAQILTQPKRAMKDCKNYKEKYKKNPGLTYGGDETYWTVNVYPGRIVVRFVF